jgi:hypothetical protein
MRVPSTKQLELHPDDKIVQDAYLIARHIE